MTTTLVQVGDAIVATIAAGEHNGKPIRATLIEGHRAFNDVSPGTVHVRPPEPSFVDGHEGIWQIASSEWSLQLYSGFEDAPSTRADAAFLQSVCAALAADPELGGAGLATPLYSSEPFVDNGERPTLFGRELRIRVDHNPGNYTP